MMCMICEQNSSNSRVIFDDRYGYPGNFQLFLCPACGHGKLDVCFAPEETVDLYTHYYPRRNCPVSPVQTAKNIKSTDKFGVLTWVPDGSKVLDIGCGDGTSLIYLQNHGCEAYGVESDRNVAPIAQRLGLNIEIGLFDASHYEEASFDYVLMEQVLEHIPDPLEILRGIFRILKPGGALIVGTPNMRSLGAKIFGKAWLNWHAPYHVSFYTRKSLALCAQKTGFVLEKCITKTNSIWYQWQISHLLWRSRTPGRPSIQWSPYCILKKNESDWGFEFSNGVVNALSRGGLFRLYGFVVDSIGLGDNFLAILRKQ